MSLQKKTLLIIFITFITLGILGYIAMRLTLFKSYKNMEADNIKQQVQRIENSINEELSDMEKLAADWGHWTDTYDFMLGENGGYEEDNLDVETLANLDLNLMLFMDRKIEPIACYLIDLENKLRLDNSDFMKDFQNSYQEILKEIALDEYKSGIIMLPEGPMLISINPIFRNDETGPSVGHLIMGKYLKENLISRISKVAKLSVMIHSMKDKQVTKLDPRARLHFSKDTTKVSIPNNKEEISGFALIYDILNNPILILEVTVKRDILAKARESYTLFVLIFIVVILVVMLVTNSLLNQLIMKRVILLSNQANQIAISRRFDQELNYDGEDEIAKLGNTFNTMLKSLLESHNKVVELNQYLEDKVENRTIALQESNKKLLLEVQERSAIQLQLESSLLEKDVLLKEVYHRVKNNLQVINSLLNLQAGQSDNEEVKQALQSSRSRVHSMSLVHEQLYRSDSLRFIVLRKYLNNIVTHLFGLYNIGNKNVSYQVICDDINMTVSQVIPCGLIVTELVSNSLKYAFKGLDKGEVLVKFQKLDDKMVNLEITDNGKGLPQDFDPANSRSLGLKLVDSLALQLGGKLITELESSKFSITFMRKDGGK